MRTMIVSDTHGKHKGIERALTIEKPIDLLIHLGDVLDYQDYYQMLAECPIEVVAGNNDFFSDLPQEQVIEVDGCNIFMTHGHYYYVEYNHDELVKAARQHHCSIAMYGHTHRPVIEELQGVTVVNPGSMTYPRQPGHKPSYIIMETLPGKKPNFTIHYLDDSEW